MAALLRSLAGALATQTLTVVLLSCSPAEDSQESGNAGSKGGSPANTQNAGRGGTSAGNTGGRGNTSGSSNASGSSNVSEAGAGGSTGDDTGEAGTTGNTAGVSGSNGDPGTGGSSGTNTKLTLTSTGFLKVDGDLVFPKESSYPTDQSPPFSWSGAPEGTKSFALTFVDKSNGAVKWIVWDIPASVTSLPANLSKEVHPTEVPEATQRGSLKRTGYSGPGVAGPPMHTYEFVIWAMKVGKLPGTDSLETKDIRASVLPKYELSHSAPLVAKGQLNGP